jgi:hypothetical protein
VLDIALRDDRDLCDQMSCPALFRRDDCVPKSCPRLAAFQQQHGAIFMIDEHDRAQFVGMLPGVKRSE